MFLHAFDYRCTFRIANMQQPPMTAKANETRKMLEKPNSEMTAAAMTGAMACVSVVPRV